MGFVRLACDCHVHFHPGYDEVLFWDSLASNLAAGVRSVYGDAPGEVGYMVLLTESAGADFFSRWRDRGVAGPAGIRFVPTGEPYSLTLVRDGGPSLLVVQGRQIVTAERLEVLTAGPRGAIPDGRPLARVVDELTTAGELAILPWGAGKWLGTRGRLVEELAQGNTCPTFFLADNTARPAWWPAPRAFRFPVRRGQGILRGSDPLPLPGEEKRAGAFAFLLAGGFDANLPLASLKTLLGGAGPLVPLGRRDGTIRFARRQVGLRLLPKRPAAGAPAC